MERILLMVWELMCPELEEVEVAVAWLDSAACEAGRDAFPPRVSERIFVRGTAERTPAAAIP